MSWRCQAWRLEPTRGPEAALTLTGPRGMHKLPGDHNMTPRVNAEKESWGLPGTAAW